MPQMGKSFKKGRVNSEKTEVRMLTVHKKELRHECQYEARTRQTPI